VDIARLPVAITMGDACGIGPEIVLKACAERGDGSPRVVYGDPDRLERTARTLGLAIAVSAHDTLSPALVEADEVAHAPGHARRRHEPELAGRRGCRRRAARRARRGTRSPPEWRGPRGHPPRCEKRVGFAPFSHLGSDPPLAPGRGEGV
jgi:hypothetical protein